MLSRCIPLIGSDGLEKIKNSNICIFGIGGVGGYVCEAIARMGVLNITIIDSDVVNESNINRQIIALNSTIGRQKVEVMAERIKDINPSCNVICYNTFVDETNIGNFDFSNYDYIIDCIDTVKSKLLIIEKAKKFNIPIISSMGTGNKLDPLKFEIKDISKTTVCPLAKVVRLELRKRGIKDVKVLFSTEEPIKSPDFISSVGFVPSVAGLLIAREVILDIKNK